MMLALLGLLGVVVAGLAADTLIGHTQIVAGGEPDAAGGDDVPADQASERGTGPTGDLLDTVDLQVSSDPADDPVSTDKPNEAPLGQVLTGGGGNDNLFADAGQDTLAGQEGHDFLGGRGGDDLLDGGSGDDHAGGGSGSDTLLGGEGRDELQGEDGHDKLDGGAGDDRLGVGAGDQAHGGQGADSFSLSVWMEADDVAHIADYVPGEDEIVVIYDPEAHPDPQLSLVSFPGSADATVLLDGMPVAEVAGGAGMDLGALRLVSTDQLAA